MISKTDRLKARIEQLRGQLKIDSWTQFVREMRVPNDLMPAIVSGRHQLMPKARALAVEECEVVYDLISVLLETNAVLREHTKETANLVADWQNAMKGLGTLAGHVTTFANLQKEEDEDEVEVNDVVVGVHYM